MPFFPLSPVTQKLSLVTQTPGFLPSFCIAAGELIMSFAITPAASPTPAPPQSYYLSSAKGLVWMTLSDINGIGSSGLFCET